MVSVLPTNGGRRATLETRLEPKEEEINSLPPPCIVRFCFASLFFLSLERLMNIRHFYFSPPIFPMYNLRSSHF